MRGFCPTFVKSKRVHNDEREINASLQLRHTWVNVIRP